MWRKGGKRQLTDRLSRSIDRSVENMRKFIADIAADSNTADDSVSSERLTLTRRQLLEETRTSNLAIFQEVDREVEAGGRTSRLLSSLEMLDLDMSLSLDTSLGRLTLDENIREFDSQVMQLLEKGIDYLQIKFVLKGLAGRELTRAEKDRVTELAKTKYTSDGYSPKKARLVAHPCFSPASVSAAPPSSVKNLQAIENYSAVCTDRKGVSSGGSGAQDMRAAQPPAPPLQQSTRPTLLVPPQSVPTPVLMSIDQGGSAVACDEGDPDTYLTSAMQQAKHFCVPVYTGVQVTDHYTLGDRLGVGSFCKVVVGICRKNSKSSTASISNADAEITDSAEAANRSAVKIFNHKPDTQEEREQVLCEMMLLAKLSCPHIISLLAVYETDSLCLVTELMGGGELFEFVAEHGEFVEVHARQLMSCLFQALAHLHSLNIVHRDVKLENMLLPSALPPSLTQSVRDDPNLLNTMPPLVLKLGDFGLARQLRQSSTPMWRQCGPHEQALSPAVETPASDSTLTPTSSICRGPPTPRIVPSTASVLAGKGTDTGAWTESEGSVLDELEDENLPELRYTLCGSGDYIAPETFRRDGYGVDVDMWASGVVFYILLCGFPPDVPRIRRQGCNVEKDFPGPWWDSCSNAAKRMVTECLSVDPTQRMTAQEAVEQVA